MPYGNIKQVSKPGGRSQHKATQTALDKVLKKEVQHNIQYMQLTAKLFIMRASSFY